MLAMRSPVPVAPRLDVSQAGTIGTPALGGERLRALEGG